MLDQQSCCAKIWDLVNRCILQELPPGGRRENINKEYIMHFMFLWMTLYSVIVTTIVWDILLIAAIVMWWSCLRCSCKLICNAFSTYNWPFWTLLLFSLSLLKFVKCTFMHHTLSRRNVHPCLLEFLERQFLFLFFWFLLITIHQFCCPSVAECLNL